MYVLFLSLSVVGIMTAISALNNTGLLDFNKVYADIKFNEPEGVAVGSSGNIYVVDGANNRIEKFTKTGTFIRTWGTYGTGNGQFDDPNDIALDSSGNVYVTDFGNNRIQKFKNDGTFIRKWGTLGTGNGQFNGPSGIGINLDTNNVYVADEGNNQIQEFKNDGTFIRKWGSLGSDPISNVALIPSDQNPFKPIFQFK